MGDFITGIKDKYPAQLLKGRMEIEGNVLACLMKDLLLLDETAFEVRDFVTKDGNFYFQMLKKLREKGFYSLDEVTILSSFNEDVITKYDELGGWETIEHLISIINLQNFDVYIDEIYRENILMRMHDDGFNLLKSIDVNGKNVIPLNLFRKMTAEEVTDWYEARMSSYGTGYSSKIIEEEEIDFDDEFIENCAEGENTGVPFEIAGQDIYGEDMNCLGFISRQIQGLAEGTFSILAGFSSAGKSTIWITILMALLYNDRKILIISNEETIKKYKIKFMLWLLAKRNKYFKLTKKKMMSGNIDNESREQLKDVQEYWREHYKGRVKLVVMNDADMTIVKKKVRENVLRYGYDTVLLDTFKIQEADMYNSRTDLALVRDSRELDKLAKKYNIISLASAQLAEAMRGTLFLSASTLSNAKQLKEICENLFLMRSVYAEELDPKSKYYCNPYRLKHVGDKWVEEEFSADPSAVWRIFFIDKCRSGANSSDNGQAYLLRYDGDHCLFKESAMCRPKHGEIR